MFTKEMVTEYLKCEKDFFYFGEKYLGFDFSDFKTPDSKFKKYICARQVGKTTYLTAYAFWNMIFKDGHYTLFLSHNHNGSLDAYKVLMNHYDKLKDSILGNFIIPVKSYSKTLKLENESTIYFSHGKNAGRGLSLNLLILDEAAFFDDLDYIYTALYPTIATMKNSELILATTPSDRADNMLRLDTLQFEEKRVYSKKSKEFLEYYKTNFGLIAYNRDFLGA